MEESSLTGIRRKYIPKLPKILQSLSQTTLDRRPSPFNDKEELKSLFPHLFGKPLLHLKKDVSVPSCIKPFKVGVVFSGGQAPGGHNVIAGLFDALKLLHKDSVLIGFLNGPGGIVEGKYKELTLPEANLFRNMGGFDWIGSGRTKIETDEQLKKSLEVVERLKLDALVVIGGDDSNTNAALLAEYFIQHQCESVVVGVPKTIDGDLQNPCVDISFGFDSACKSYSEMIGNIARDALSAKKYTHFIKLMGRSASHIVLECALQTHPNLALIGEEISSNKMTLNQLIEDMAQLIMDRSSEGKEFGLILIPEGLIEAIVELKRLIMSLNTLLAKQDINQVQDPLATIKKQLEDMDLKVINSLPEGIQRQLLMDRDPHGNVQLTHIDTEKMLIEMVGRRLKEKGFKGRFSPVSHFFGYEGRSGFPSNFDATYCYALGFAAAALIRHQHSGYMACIGHLARSWSEWEVYGMPLVSLMHLEVRKGKNKPVIAKALVDLHGKPFQTFAAQRNVWRLGDHYQFPGPMQFYGESSVTDTIPKILEC